MPCYLLSVLLRRCYPFAVCGGVLDGAVNAFVECESASGVAVGSQGGSDKVGQGFNAQGI